ITFYVLACCRSPPTHNSNNSVYRYYGGRNVTVCERWQTFEAFYADRGDPPPGMSIDRINVEEDYEPSNCQWATSSMQARYRFDPFATLKLTAISPDRGARGGWSPHIGGRCSATNRPTKGLS